MKQKGLTRIELLVGLTIIVVLFFSLLGWVFLSQIKYSEGKREGTLVKWSEKGLFIKNWCGEIQVGSYQGSIGAYLFGFGIFRGNDKILSKIDGLMGKHVEITYEQRVGSNPFLGCNDYHVIDIQEVK